MLRIAAALFAVMCALGSGLAAAAAELPKGHVMLAKTQPKIVLIWDATPAVADLVDAKKSPDDMLRALEANAIEIMAARPEGRPSQGMSIRVVYQRTAALNPAYASATLQGVEKLFTIDAPRADVVKNAHAWKDQLAGGSTPMGLTVTITGKLPGQ